MPTLGKLLLAFVLANLAIPATFAGMYDQPYAIVESGNASELRKEARVAISQVDGKNPRNARKSDPLAPGKHVITLHFESARGIFRPTSLDVELDLQALHSLSHRRQLREQDRRRLETEGLFRAPRRMRQEIQEESIEIGSHQLSDRYPNFNCPGTRGRRLPTICPHRHRS